MPPLILPSISGVLRDEGQLNMTKLDAVVFVDVRIFGGSRSYVCTPTKRDTENFPGAAYANTSSEGPNYEQDSSKRAYLNVEMR